MLLTEDQRLCGHLLSCLLLPVRIEDEPRLWHANAGLALSVAPAHFFSFGGKILNA